MDSIAQVKEIIEQRHISSNGKCGITIPDICYKSNLSFLEVNKILRQLYEQKFFCLKQGINGYLIFKTETI